MNHILIVSGTRSPSICSHAAQARTYDVAKLLGDTVETVENHYAPFVRELRERCRQIMENGQGLEIAGTPQPQLKLPGGKPN